MLIEEAFDPPDRGLGLRGAGDTCCEFAVPDVSGLADRADHQDQERTLVFAVLGEKGDKMQPERVQKRVGRVPLFHDLARIVTPRKTVGYCGPSQRARG